MLILSNQYLTWWGRKAYYSHSSLGLKQHSNSLDWLFFHSVAILLERKIEKCHIFVQIFLGGSIKAMLTLELHGSKKNSGVSQCMQLEGNCMFDNMLMWSYCISFALVLAGIEWIFIIIAKFWICAENSAENTGMFSLPLSRVYTALKTFLPLSIRHQWGSWEGRRSCEKTQVEQLAPIHQRDISYHVLLSIYTGGGRLAECPLWQLCLKEINIAMTFNARSRDPR